MEGRGARPPTAPIFLLYSALDFTVIDILVCITSIFATPNLLRSPADATQVVVGAIALTSICLGFYARLIRAMVQPMARR